MSKNRYTRALKHLKNKTIDEKLELLTELPTNHTTGLYVDVPGGEVTPPPVPGPIDAPADYSQDGDGSPGYQGKDTTGLFMTDGTIKTVEPPGDTSYILGPMSSMWYAWANYTQIGYIRQEDRKMVNLGRITGQLDDWDGVTGFTDYGQLTLEQAVWFKNITRINDYRAFYPGPPSSVADEYGRYVCSITGESKPTERQPPTNFEPGTQRGGNPEDDLALLSQEEERRRADERNRLILNAVMLGLDIAAVIALLFPEPASTAAGAARLASKLRYVSKLRMKRGALNPFGQRAVRSGAAGRQRVSVYSGRSGYGKMRNDPGRTAYASTNRSTAGRFAQSNQVTKGSTSTPRGGTVYKGELPQRYVDKYGSRTVQGFRQVKMSKGAADKAFKKVVEYLELKGILLESAPTGSGAGGGADIADAYVDGVSQKASPEELEQASNDANAIAKQGGQGLSDSELAKIDNEAEAEAKRLTNLDFDRPNSMSNEQLSSTLNLIYDADPDWLDDTVEKFDHLLPTDEIKELEKEYEERESELETTREDIKSQIEEIESQYNDKGGSWDQGGLRVYGDANWGSQFTPQNFESSGQSFEEYEGLRAQLGFFNGNDGPDEYGRYIPLSWRDIMDAQENGYTPEQFTGVAREIVEASYRLNEIESNPNFPRPGRNIYNSEEDYNEAVSLQNEHGPLMSKYIQLWEGPGGYDDLAKKLYDYDTRSREMMKEAAYKAAKEKEQLKFKLDNLEGDLNKEYQEDYLDLYRPFLIRLIEEWNNSIGQDYDPYSLEDINPADFASMSEEEKEKLRETLLALGISYGDIASADVMNLGVDATAAVLGLGIAGLMGLYNVTVDAATNFINAVSTSNPAVAPDGETSQQAREREAAEKKLADAEAQYGPDSDEAAEARRERSDTLSRHKRERRGETGSTTGDARRKKEAEQEAAKKAREERLRREQEARNRENEEKIKRQREKERKGRQRTSEDEIGDLLRGETYNPPKFLKNRERKSITEVGIPNQKRILREIKKPVVIDEGPTKFKVKPTGRKNKSVGSTMMNKVETPLTYKPVNNIWSKKDKARNIRASQERKNQVLELVGAAEHHWTYLTEDRRKKRQEKVNEMMSAEFDKSLELMYENYKKSIDGKAEKLVNKIRTKVKPEYPKTPPPQLDPETGMHPKYGKKYKHDKLDPHSAESMPPTGNPVIDANAKKAHDPVQKARKLKILQGKSKSKTFENFDNSSKKKIYEDIAIKETKYLRYFIENSSVPKHYDWELGEFNELPEINKVVLKRLETIENALSEGMTTKDFKYLYGGVITNDIVSLNPNLVSSTFAHDLISTSSEVTSHMFGPDFPGSHINSIGDFNPQSYSKVDVLATASWNSIQDVTPAGWTPENSYEYDNSVSDVVTPGQESDVFKDTLFGEVTVTGTDFSLSTGDDEDSSQENTVDIEDLRTLFPGVTFPTAFPMPGETQREDPVEASMLLRTFKSIKVGQEITFNYSFTSAETEEDNDVTYRGATREVPGDDGIMDDYAFVLIAGKVQKIVSVMARDGNNIDFNFRPDADDYYKPDVLQSRFPLTGRYRYTVKPDDIDDHGNLKLFVGVMDSGDSSYESNLDVTNFKLDSSRLAAGQLGKTTDAYDLGTSVDSLVPPIPKGNAEADLIGDLMLLGPISLLTAKALIAALGLAGASALTRSARVLDQFAKWWDKGKNARVGNEDTASLWDLFTDDISQLTRSDAAFKSGQTGLKTLRPFKSVLDPKMRATGPTPLIRQGGRVLTKPLGPTLGARNESYDLIFEQVDPDDKFFRELKKVVVKLKKPEQVEKLSKFLKKVSKAKEKSESRNAEENNSNSNALYPGQPSPNGFPDTPPPKMVNGYHPEFGKRENRYRRLDPHSAESMPLTGDPEIDVNVKKARDDVQKVRKLKNLIGKMKSSS